VLPAPCALNTGTVWLVIVSMRSAGTSPCAAPAYGNGRFRQVTMRRHHLGTAGGVHALTNSALGEFESQRRL
jgi:hypothetical protein